MKSYFNCIPLWKWSINVKINLKCMTLFPFFWCSSQTTHYGCCALIFMPCFVWTDPAEAVSSGTQYAARAVPHSKVMDNTSFSHEALSPRPCLCYLVWLATSGASVTHLRAGRRLFWERCRKVFLLRRRGRAPHWSPPTLRKQQVTERLWSESLPEEKQ